MCDLQGLDVLTV